MRIWIENKQIARGVRHVARIEGSARSTALWFDIESDHPVPELQLADPFACALLMICMRSGEPLQIEGDVSRRLLQNLDEFQAVYRAWMPRSWKQVDITARNEVTVAPDPALSNRAVVALSGGMDGAFSYLRHRHGRDLARPLDVTAAFLVHGFDSRVSHVEDFEFMRKSVTGLIGDDPVALYTIRTNLRDARLVPNWSHAHGTGLAACAHFFAATHGVGLIGGDFKYSDYPPAWGSSPVINHLLSSERLRMTYDGAEYSRTQKAEWLSDYPTAMKNLSVCHKGPAGEPCCTCEKCIRTVLNFRVVGKTPPENFRLPIRNEDISAMIFDTVPRMIFARDLYLTAKRRGVTDSWVKHLGTAIRKTREAEGAPQSAPQGLRLRR
ncbi:hypothetical protein [Falsirhodobacter xinxiangensis]|uniref:hypothetical protein n=1 Tax=Falsirhodobacter xinxiangensis TaxID=2530049 RepID=UPI0010AB4624|nr:hypothetical protein [Rhodobacter xinxiangensis]